MPGLGFGPFKLGGNVDWNSELDFDKQQNKFNFTGNGKMNYSGKIEKKVKFGTVELYAGASVSGDGTAAINAYKLAKTIEMSFKIHVKIKGEGHAGVIEDDPFTGRHEIKGQVFATLEFDVTTEKNPITYQLGMNGFPESISKGNAKAENFKGGIGVTYLWKGQENTRMIWGSR